MQVDVPISEATAVNRGKNTELFVSISLEHTVAQSNHAFWTWVILFSMVGKAGNWVRFNLVNDIVKHELLREMTWRCK